MKKVLLPLLLMLSLMSISSYSQTNITRKLHQGVVAYTDSLTAPGNFATFVIYAYDPTLNPLEEITFQFEASATADVDSVNVKVETSLDNSHWINIAPNGETTMLVVATNHTIIFTRLRSALYIRAVFIDETGGTDAKVVLRVKGG